MKPNQFFTAGTRVHCRKLSAQNEELLPTNYWVEGITFSDVELGRPIKIVRSRRARQLPSEPKIVNCAGLFTSSPVEELTRKAGVTVAKTRNSHWKLTTCF